MFAQFFNRLTDSVFDRHASIKPCVETILIDAEAFGYLSNNHALSVYNEGSIISFVSIVLFKCLPPAVFRRVVTIVVNSSNCTSLRVLWFWPHVCDEVRKRIAPAFAHLNAASAIIWVASVCLFCTSSAHTHPRIPFGGFACAVLAFALFFHKLIVAESPLKHNRWTN